LKIYLYVNNIITIKPTNKYITIMPGKLSTKTADKATNNNLKMPIKKDGTIDNRYTAPQVCKSDGTRDMRTTNTNLKK
jgi:hypothetical protein